MANENVVVNISATSDFSNLIADVNRVSASLAKLQRDLVTSDKALGKNVQKLNADFANALTSSGQFSKYFVSLTSGAEKFGQSLDTGRLKLRDYFSTLRTHFTEQKSLISDLAKQQVQLQNAIVQPLGKNAQGLMQYNIMVARGLDEVANKTKVAQMQAAIMNRVIQQGANQLINWGKNTQWAGRQLTVGLTVPIAAFGKAAADAFRLADKELVRLTKVYGDLGGATANELGKIRDEVVATAKDLSSSLGASFRETLGLAADIAATGKTGSELLGSVRETTRLAVLGEVDRQEAMKATLAIQTAFKQNTEELTESINFLNAVENQTSTSLNDLVEAIPKAGPIIKGLGGSIQDLALYMTAMREGGISAGEGANALKSALASLINPTDVAVAKFKGFGIDLLGIVQSNAGNVTQTLLSLQAALDRLDPLQKQQAIEQLFGKFQFSRLNALFENLGKQGSQTLQVLDLMKASTAELGSVADRELAMVTESASGRYARAIEKLKADLAGVGESFLGIATKIINVIDKFVNFVGNLPDPIKKVMGLAAGITAIAGPIIMLTGVLGNFFGYIIKGVSHFRAFFKGAEGWKLLTPEILAANAAAQQIDDTFYSDAKAAEVLKNALQNLINEYTILENKVQSANVSLVSSVSTIQDNPLFIGPREVDPNNPLIGPYQTRASAHMNPVAEMTPEQRAAQTFLGMVPSSVQVNRLVGANPMILAQGDLPRIEGLTSFTRKVGRGASATNIPVSTGVLSDEVAKWHSLTSALAMSSKEEIADLKKSIAMTGTVTTEFMEKFDDILPGITQITDNGARMSAAIVAELQEGKITLQVARDKIIALNFEIERMLAEEVTRIAAARGITINPQNVPMLQQPAANPVSGESNMRQMFRRDNEEFLRNLGTVLGVKTSGAGYNVQTTRPKRLNLGGPVYNPQGFGSIVPGPEVNADVVPAMLTPGEFVVNRDATRANLPLLVAINGGLGSDGPNKFLGGRVRDIVRSVLGIKAKGPNATAFLQQIDDIQDPALKAKYLAIAKAHADKMTRSKKDPKFYSPVAKTIQEKNIDDLNAIFKENGLPPLPYAPGRHATHLTVSKKLGGGKTLVSDYTVGFSGQSNLAANRNALKPADLITRDLKVVPGLNKYDRILRAAGIPANKWGDAEREIDAAIKAYFEGEARRRGVPLAGLPPIGDRPESGAAYTFTKDIIPRIESVLPRYNDKALYMPSYRALKENKTVRSQRRNMGGQVRGYNRGGMVGGYANGGMVRQYKMGGKVPGVQYKNAGGLIASMLLSQLGFTTGATLGQNIGGNTGQMIGGSLGSILPFMLMGGMGGGDINAKYDKSIFAGSRFGQSMLAQATSAGKLSSAMAKAVLGLSRFNLAIGGIVIAGAAVIKIFNDQKEANERLADSYGLSESRAKSLKLEYTDYIDVLQGSLRTMSEASARNRLIYESMASAKTPLNLTIKQYKELRKEIKQTMQTEIDMINNADESELPEIAKRLKVQFMAAGMSAQDANKKINALFELTEYSELASKVTLLNKDFMNLKNSTDVALEAYNQFQEATSKNLPVGAQVRALQTALQATDAVVEKTVNRNKKDGESQGKRYQAEVDFLNKLKAKNLDQVELSDKVKGQLISQDLELVNIIGRYETIVSLWQKIQIAAKGYTGDLKGLNPQAVDALYNLVGLVSEQTTKSTSAQGGALFNEYKLLQKLESQRKSLMSAMKGQSAAEQISSRKRIEALQKEIDKINEAADARQKALQEEQEDEDYLIQIQKKKLEYQDALAAGDMSRAAQAQLDIQSLTRQQQKTLTSRAIEEKRQRDIEPLQLEIDRINKANEDLADKAALAGDGLDKLNEKISNLRDKIDTVNKALTDYRVAVLTGQDAKQRKEEAAALLQALGIDISKVTPPQLKNRTTAPGASDLAAAEATRKNKIVTTADEILNKIFGTKVDKVTMEAAEVYINESKAGTRKSPTTFSPSQLRESGLKPGQTPSNINLSSLVKNNKLESGEIFEVNGVKYRVLNDYRSTFPTAEKMMGGGPIKGPGTATSDSIPILASNGEYMFSAKAVKNAGGPSVVDAMHQYFKGANRMKEGGGIGKPSLGSMSFGLLDKILKYSSVGSVYSGVSSIIDSLYQMNYDKRLGKNGLSKNKNVTPIYIRDMAQNYSTEERTIALQEALRFLTEKIGVPFKFAKTKDQLNNAVRINWETADHFNKYNALAYAIYPGDVFLPNPKELNKFSFNREGSKKTIAHEILHALGETKFERAKSKMLAGYDFSAHSYNPFNLMFPDMAIPQQRIGSSEVENIRQKQGFYKKSINKPKFHNWNGTVPGPYNKEISATLKAGTEGVYQNSYIASLKDRSAGNTYYNQPKIEVHAAPGMDESMLADLVLKKFNQQNARMSAAQGRSVLI